jgi:poly-gamma-glutamate capsule biosynthesis protein CapA/YwtB (metallophosphatase superfamily)
MKMKGFFLPMKQLIILFIVALYTCIQTIGCNEKVQKQLVHTKPTLQNSSIQSANTVNAAPADTITIAAVGDVMLGTNYPTNAALPPDSGKSSFTSAMQHLRNADITFGNLEGVLLDTGEAATYKLNFRTRGHLFRMPTCYGGILKTAGFDVLSMANNHVDDFSKAGRKNTVKLLDSLGIKHAGLLSYPSASFTIKGVKYGFCAFSPNSQTVSLQNLGYAKKIIRQLKQDNDIVIVSFHGGGEGTNFEHVTKTTETYKGENRGNVYQFAHTAIDAGADVVFGNGPHVVRAMELYNKRLIAYSLGNFCTYKGVSISGICGLAPLLKVKLNKKGHFLNGQIISYKQTHEHGLQPDPANKAAARIRSLTETDFLQSDLTVSDDGRVTTASIN